ncbi:MAG: alpha/beta hydrolase, partial [Kordiimonadaceae bacterium]|nr:alpha/beta hydrolase [Kordiimonadaceae bacterium]
LKGGHMPKAQLLYYPFTDGDHAKYRSYDLFGDGYGLDKDFMQMATELLLVKPSDANHRWLNLNDTVQFKSQPATIVATAGFDPIRDQGRVFAEKLKVAGVDVTHHHYASLNHGFLESSYVIDDAEKACFETARMMGALLRK